jgi:hypothetical protein
VLAPEERHVVERSAETQHVVCDRLPLALGRLPMLHADAGAEAHLGVSRDITRRPDVRRAGTQVRVHEHAVVDFEPGPLGEPDSRLHADAHDDEIGGQSAAGEFELVLVDGAQLGRKVETHALLFVQLLHVAADLFAHDVRQRHAVTAHHVDLELAGPQRGGDLQANEARTDHDDAARLRGRIDDGLRISQRAQRLHVRQIRARDRQP